MNFLGIDPGKTGAAALIDDQGRMLEVADWPGDHVAAAQLLARWVYSFGITCGAIERVHSGPGEGVKSAFSFGQNYGSWLGVTGALYIPMLNPTPQEWQTGLVRKTDGPDAKARSLSVARRLFPSVDCLSRKKDHGRADALLIAWWAKERSVKQCEK